MNLTKQLKEKIVERFKDGANMSEIGVWYGKGTLVIEAVIRDWMVEHGGALPAGSEPQDGRKESEET